MNYKRIEMLEKIFEKRKKKGSHEIISLEAINLKTIRETMYIRDNPKKTDTKRTCRRTWNKRK